MAKRFYTLIGIFTICMIVPQCLIILSGRNLIASYITSDEEVKDTVSDMFVLVAIVYLFDGAQGFM